MGEDHAGGLHGPNSKPFAMVMVGTSKSKLCTIRTWVGDQELHPATNASTLALRRVAIIYLQPITNHSHSAYLRHVIHT